MKTKIILDTDIGDDVDDAFALALAMRAPECELMGVTTAFHDTAARARIACRLLSRGGCADVPVAMGRKTGDDCREQKKWAEHYTEKQAITPGAVDFILAQCEAHPKEITLVTIGPLTNLSDLLEADPHIGRLLKGVVMMAGKVSAEEGQPLPIAEWNVKCDIGAAKRALEAGLNPVLVGLDVTMAMKVPPICLKALRESNDPVARALEDLRELWGHGAPILHDPLAVAHAVGHTFFGLEERCIVVDDEGRTRCVNGKHNAKVALRPDPAGFMKYYFGTMLGGVV